jgi:hypothetical protein
MQSKQGLVLDVALAVITSATLLIGCATRKDAISQAQQTEKTRPGIAETKAIAEEGFIYGLPLVMNYAVMNEFAVNTKSSRRPDPFGDAPLLAEGDPTSILPAGEGTWKPPGVKQAS